MILPFLWFTGLPKNQLSSRFGFVRYFTAPEIGVESVVETAMFSPVSVRSAERSRSLILRVLGTTYSTAFDKSVVVAAPI